MKKITMMAVLTASSAIFALGGSDAWMRQNLVDMNMNTGVYAPPPPMPEDLNGNWWTTPDFMAVEVPLGGYNGYSYRMKVRWEDGTEREFHLPYPWGDVTIYKNQAKVYLGVSGRGLFYNNWIGAL